MTKREAKRRAYTIAYRFVQQALDAGPWVDDEKDEANQKKIEDALDTIAQRLFEHSDIK